MTKRKPRNRRGSGGERTTRALVEAGYSTRFQPGQSGNPLGRPSTKLLRNLARELAEERDAKKRKQKARVWIEALDRKACKGSLGHFEMLLRLLEEDAGVDLRIAGPGGGDIPVKPAHTSEELLELMRAIYGLRSKKPDDAGGRKENALDSTSVQP